MTTTPFPKTDLARILRLDVRVRTLAVLAALRFVAADDLALADVDGNALASLHDAKLVSSLRLQRRMTDTAPTEVLALTRAGSLELARVLDVDSSSVPYSTKAKCDRSAMFMDHTLARNRFALLLARDLRGGVPPAALLSWEHEADRLADAVHVAGKAEMRRQPLVADGLAVVGTTYGVEGLLIEIDRGTEKPGYMARKYAGYLHWWKEGGPMRKFSVKAMRLLTIGPDAKRTEKLREACIGATEKRAGGLFWFASEEDLVREGMLGPVWSTSREEHISLWRS